MEGLSSLVTWQNGILLCIIVSIISLIIAVSIKKFQFRFKLELIIFMSTILFGTYAFYYESNFVNDTQKDVQVSLYSALFNSFRLFLLDPVESFEQTNGTFFNYPWTFELARLCGAAFTVLAIIKIFFRLFHKEMKLYFQGWFGGQTIIIGYNNYVEMLIRNLIEEKQKVIVVASNTEEADLEKWQEVDVTFIRLDFTDPKLMKKIKLDKAKTVVLFDENDGLNIDNYLHILLNSDYLLMRPKEKPLNVVLHVKGKKYQKVMAEIEESLGAEAETANDLYENRERIELRVVNVYSIMVNQMMQKYPLYRNYEQEVRLPEGKFHIGLIGFGETAKFILLSIIENLHIVNPNGVHLSIYDKNADRKEREWNNHYPELKGKINIDFHSFDFDIDGVENLPENFTHSYICLPDDYQNLLIAMDMKEKNPKVQVYARMWSNKNAQQWISKFKIQRIGDFEKALTSKVFINEELDEQARTLHEFYRDPQDSSTIWPRLSYFLKDSNRAVINHIDFKLLIAGLEKIKKTEASSDHEFLDKVAFENHIKTVLDELGQIEHRRWCTFHYINDWKWIEPSIAPKYKIPQTREHTALCEWHYLDEVKRITKRDNKASTFDIIKKTWDILDKNEYGVRVKFKQGD